MTTKSITAPLKKRGRRMTPTERKVLLLRAGITQTDIARELGITKNSINQEIHDRRTSKRIRKAIARAVDRPVEELWPQAKKAA